MTKRDFDALLVMGSIHRVLKAEKVLGAAGIAVDTLVTPREISADCGMVVTLGAEDLEAASEVLHENGVPPAEVWIRREGELRRLAASAVD